MATLSTVEAHLFARRAPALTREDEIKLARRIVRGDLVAKQRLVEANLHLVRRIAGRQPASAIEHDDLLQEGVLGLIRAAGKFDHTKGCRFATYATWWVSQAIQRALREQSRIVRLPASATDKLRGIRAAERRLAAARGHAPDSAALSSATGLTRAELALLRAVDQPPRSLDATFEGAPLRGEPAAEDVERAERAMDDVAVRQTLGHAIADLPDPRQRRVLELHYGLGGRRPKTLKQIAAGLALTPARISQLEKSALEALRSGPAAPTWRDAIVI
jgi:RNA polymerase primary sigma factor